MTNLWHRPIGRRALLKSGAMAGAVIAGLAPYRLMGTTAATARTIQPATYGITVTPDRTFDRLLEAYGDSSTGWTGSDGAYSVPLPDGRVIWLFGDTFLGTVNPDHSRPPGSPMVHNTAIVQDGTQLTTLYSGTHAQPGPWVSPPDGIGWYWPSDGTVEGNNLRVFLSQFIRTGPGGWDFLQVATHVATLSLPDLQFTSITPMAAGYVKTWRGTYVSFGVAIMEDDLYTYLYGVEDVPYNKYCHVARAQAGNVLGPWEFFNGTGWTDDSQHSVRILDGIADSYSVTKTSKGYILIAQDHGIGKDIRIYQAAHPTGPWGSGSVLYSTPESGGDLYTYAAMAHPEFSGPDDLLISYDVNSFVFKDVFTNVNNYRPRFIRATFTGA